MNKEEIIRKVEEIVKNKLSDRSHDFEHTKRVYNIALKLAKHYRQVDLFVLKLAALLHDIAREDEDKDKTGKIDHALLGADIARKILAELGAEKEIIEKVAHAIETHRFKANRKPETIEAKLLFDADKIDVLGAVGIARAFMTAGKYGQNPWELDFDLKAYVKENMPNGRIKDISKHSPYKEFLIKLAKVPGRMQTEVGRKVAEKRLEFMREFFERFKKEIKGEDVEFIVKLEAQTTPSKISEDPPHQAR